jgi:hypothetical protein
MVVRVSALPRASVVVRELVVDSDTASLTASDQLDVLACERPALEPLCSDQLLPPPRALVRSLLRLEDVDVPT